MTKQLTICENKLRQTKINPDEVFEYNDVKLLWQELRKLQKSLWTYEGSDDEYDDGEYEDEEYENEEDDNGAGGFVLTKNSKNPYVLNFAF